MLKERFQKIIVFALCAALLVPVSAEAKKISSDSEAKELAKKKVKSARVVEVESDYDDGMLVYEVELVKGNKEYKLVYRASNSRLIEFDWELMDKSSQKKHGANLSKKAIRHKAKKKVKKASIISVHMDKDDGITEYKVRMKKGSKKYTLVYNAKSGSLMEYDWEIVKH